MVFTAHFFGTSPAYRTARPGRLIRPTNVAAVSCQAVSPVSSQFGSEQLFGDCGPVIGRVLATHGYRVQRRRRSVRTSSPSF